MFAIIGSCIVLVCVVGGYLLEHGNLAVLFQPIELLIIGGAAVWGLRHFIHGQLLSLDWILGFLASLVTSVLLMKWMLDYVKGHSFAIFMWYRLAAGTLLIALFFLRG